MNYLAHLYLSFDIEEIIVGNFIGDAVKGKSYLNYRQGIQNGIMLHRKIDKFTDEHNISKQISKLFMPEYRKYSGIVVDIIYDYYLCWNWEKYNKQENLQNFIRNKHKILLKNYSILPAKMKTFLPIMIAKNRLYSYSNLEGIKNSLYQMSKYTSLPNAADFAIKTLKENHNFINDNFLVFFDEIIEFALTEIQKN